MALFVDLLHHIMGMVKPGKEKPPALRYNRGLIHERLKVVTHVRDSKIKRFIFNPYIAHKSGNHLRELFQIICAFLLTFYQLGLLAYCNLHLYSTDGTCCIPISPMFLLKDFI